MTTTKALTQSQIKAGPYCLRTLYRLVNGRNQHCNECSDETRKHRRARNLFVCRFEEADASRPQMELRNIGWAIRAVPTGPAIAASEEKTPYYR